MKAKCDNCSETFEYKQHSESVNGVEVVFSECPNCGDRGFINVFDEELNKLVQQTKRLREKHSNSTTQQEEQELWAKVEKSYKKTNKLAKQKEKQYSEIIDQVIS